MVRFLSEIQTFKLTTTSFCSSAISGRRFLEKTSVSVYRAKAESVQRLAVAAIKLAPLVSPVVFNLFAGAEPQENIPVA